MLRTLSMFALLSIMGNSCNCRCGRGDGENCDGLSGVGCGPDGIGLDSCSQNSRSEGCVEYPDTSGDTITDLLPETTKIDDEGLTSECDLFENADTDDVPPSICIGDLPAPGVNCERPKESRCTNVGATVVRTGFSVRGSDGWICQRPNRVVCVGERGASKWVLDVCQTPNPADACSQTSMGLIASCQETGSGASCCPMGCRLDSGLESFQPTMCDPAQRGSSACPRPEGGGYVVSCGFSDDFDPAVAGSNGESGCLGACAGCTYYFVSRRCPSVLCPAIDPENPEYPGLCVDNGSTARCASECSDYQ